MRTVQAGQALDQRFSRVEGVLWRDTGRHVLVLPRDPGADVAVLGGGSAVLWRLLDTGAGPDRIRELLVAAGSEVVPPVEDILDCLVELTERGLLVAEPEPDRP